jgi:protein-S-isoprenylcysteine O-methyltransferase Ste14
MAIFLPATFVWYMTHFQIRAEEKALEGNFGEQYREYRLKVRRWI